MNAQVNGTETPDPTKVTKIEIAWLQTSGGTPTENEAAAVAAGRGVTLTAYQDMANFMQTAVGGVSPNAAGYALSSSYLVAGQNYTPAVRITDSAYGLGGWVRGTAFTGTTTTTTTIAATTTTTTTGTPTTTTTVAATTTTAAPSLLFTDTFTGTSLNGRWTRTLGGDAVETFNSPGVTYSSAGKAATSGALLVLNNDTVNKSVKQFKITLQATTAVYSSSNITSCSVCLVDASKGTPAVSASTAAPWNNGRLAEVDLVSNTAGSLFLQAQYFNGAQWYGAQSNDTWSTAAAYNHPATINTSYVVQIDSTATTVKFTVFAADGVTVIANPPAINWTDLNGSPSSAYICVGDPFTDFYYTAFKLVSAARTV